MVDTSEPVSTKKESWLFLSDTNNRRLTEFVLAVISFFVKWRGYGEVLLMMKVDAVFSA